MTEFDNLKSSYTTAVQFGLAMNVGYQSSKHGNEMLHELCKQLVENSNYQDSEKMAMKQELEILKDALGEKFDPIISENNNSIPAYFRLLSEKICY